MAPAVPTYAPRDSGDTVLYKVIAEHLETFLASCHDDPEATGLPVYVQQEFYDYLRCGILAYGFLRLGCDTHIPSDLVVDHWTSDGESRSYRDVLLLHDVWTTSNRLSGHKITSTLSMA